MAGQRASPSFSPYRHRRRPRSYASVTQAKRPAPSRPPPRAAREQHSRLQTVCMKCHARRRRQRPAQAEGERCVRSRARVACCSRYSTRGSGVGPLRRWCMWPRYATPAPHATGEARASLQTHQPSLHHRFFCTVSLRKQCLPACSRKNMPAERHAKFTRSNTRSPRHTPSPPPRFALPATLTRARSRPPPTTAESHRDTRRPAWAGHVPARSRFSSPLHVAEAVPIEGI